MKRLLNIFCIAALAALLLCLLPTAAFAADYTGSLGGNVTYSYDVDSKVLTISGTGAMNDYQQYGTKCPVLTNSTIKNNCTTIVIEEGVTRIGNYAFYAGMSYRMTNVTSITFPSSLAEVGEQAFTSMTKMTAFPEGSGLVTIGDRAFSGWNIATELTLPETLANIGSGAFSSWQPSSLTIPASVRTISSNAFSGWTQLETLVINEGVETIGANAFASTKLTEVNIPASVTSLDATSFGGNNLAALNVAEENSAYCSVDGILYTKDRSTLIRCPEAYQGEVAVDPACMAIVDSALSNCSGVDSVILPQGLVSIGGSSFSGTSITSITIPESVTDLGGAFSGCNFLASATINANIDALPQYLFSGCSALETVTLGSGVKGYGTSCFQGCSALTSVTSVEGAVSIPEYCFYGCSSLAQFTIPDTVTYVGERAFANCSALSEIALPEGVTSIGMYAFQYCSSITELTIPEGVTELPGFMCQFCTSLKEVTVLGDLTASSANQCISGNAFGSCPALEKLTFNCPCPDTKKLAKDIFNNSATVVKVFYPEDYPEWGEVRPFDVCNMKNYIYIPLRSTPEIELVGAEIRARAANDSWRDIRFIAKLSPAYNGTEVTRRYAEVVRHDNGAQLNIECKKDYRHNPDETVIFTLVVTGIRPEYRDVDISVTMHIEYEGPNSGTAETDTITTNVNLLENSD